MRKLRELFDLILNSNGVVHNIIEENNILGKYDEYNIVTKDENFATMFEVGGISYSSKDEEEIRNFLNSRNNFFKSIDIFFNVSIFQKRTKQKIDFKDDIENKYARSIIAKWNSSMSNRSYDTKYYIVISSSNNSLKNTLERKKDGILKGDKSAVSFYLNDRINDTSKIILNTLSKYNIRRMSADEMLSFYASYCNMKETKVKLKNGLLSDSYISTNIRFEKNYMIHEGLEKKYSRFISIKTYDTDTIDSNMMKDFLSISGEMMICENITNISKEKCVSYLTSKILNCSELVQDELTTLKEEIKTDRETIVEYSVSILITEKNLSLLDEKTKIIENIFSKYQIITVIETKFLNLKTLYFSFFPGRSNLNARKRKQTSTAISVLNCFEKDMKGYSKNQFGNDFVALFKTLNETPYMFNFHNSDKNKARGHTLVIADSESGKTVLLSFLIACLHKYPIKILVFDKLNGMYNMCNFLEGSYEEINDNFSLNPFTLEGTEENRLFLLNFIKQIGEIDENEFEYEEAIKTTLKSLYEHKEEEEVLTYTIFLSTLPKIEGLELRLTPFLNGIFDNKRCSLSFEHQLTVLAMDSILKDSKLASLVSSYVSHKLKINAQSKNQDFFVFTDESKDYITNEKIMRDKVEQLVEVRKLGGVIVDALQNIDFLDNVNNKDTYFDSFAHYIIFPTSKKATLDNLKKTLNLNESDIKFLKNTDKNKYQILLKDAVTQESVYLDVDLASLGKLLKVFNSDSSEVSRLKKLKLDSPEDWRTGFLND